MIRAGEFVAAAQARGFGLYSGVPCSYLTSFINHVIGSPQLRYVGAANEGDAVAIAAGAALGGLPAVAMLQNSGLGNAVSPLTSLTHTFRIPILLIVTWRGQPGGAADEPQHQLMGEITPGLLEQMRIPWVLFPTEVAAIGPALDAALAYFAKEGRPFALVMQKDSVAEAKLAAAPAPVSQAACAAIARPAPLHTRRELLSAIRDAASDRDILIATTGYTGRELFALGDRDNQFYMVGSMGCAASLALGLAIARPDRRIVAIDGDGSLLMRLGALTSIGAERPPNLVHVLLDNGLHESTGGQSTASASVEFCAIAAGSGFPAVAAAADARALGALVADRAPGLRFIHAPMRPGVPAGLPRPTMTPADVAMRLRALLAG